MSLNETNLGEDTVKEDTQRYKNFSPNDGPPGFTFNNMSALQGIPYQLPIYILNVIFMNKFKFDQLIDPLLIAKLAEKRCLSCYCHRSHLERLKI